MKKTIILLIFLCSIIETQAQQIVMDPGMYGILYANHSAQYSMLGKIRSEQKEIKKYQATITYLTTNINRIQAKVQKSLTEVKSIVKQGQNVIYAKDIAKDVGIYQKKAFDYAVGDPVLVGVAYKAEIALLNRTYALGTFIISALKGGEGNMMTNMERMKIINRVVAELREMRGIAYGLYIRMKYAKMGNKWKAIAREHNINLFLLNDLERGKILDDMKIW